MKSLLFIFNLFLVTDVFAQSYIPENLILPIKPGNKWIYYEIPYYNKILYTCTSEEFFYKDKKYYLIEGRSPKDSYIGKSYFRVDSNLTYYYIDENFLYDNANEYNYYKGNCKKGDKWSQQPWTNMQYPINPIYFVVKDTSQKILFNEKATIKYIFVTDSSLLITHQYWSNKFGLVDLSDEEWGGYSLAGCVIDGVAYGDTSFYTVDVNEEKDLPFTFALQQNFPNPFNPNTTIVYSIPEVSYVELKVYDILGNEVATLVNGEKSAGNYEVEFNANSLPSGIYFYQLKADGFVELKKMVLIK
jgi:hypothetical protein